MTNSIRCLTIAFCALFFSGRGAAQIAPLIANINARQTTSLDGQWQAIVDPYDVGALDYRAQPLKNNHAFYKNYKPQSESELVEYDFDTPASSMCPVTGTPSVRLCCSTKEASGTSGLSITQNHRKTDCSCILGRAITSPPF